MKIALTTVSLLLIGSLAGAQDPATQPAASAPPANDPAAIEQTQQTKPPEAKRSAREHRKKAKGEKKHRGGKKKHRRGKRHKTD
jgi:hypothetical protein